MALPLGKLTILVGAGIVGSVLAKEGRLPNVSDFFSGAFKIALRQIRQDNSTSSTTKPRNDSLLQQVNSLRQELQLLASNRSVTIVTSSGSGSSRYTIIIVVVVMGYGYIWWKGWKLPELMFATRRSLSDACGSVSKQLESVYTSISATKRHLTSRIDRVDTKIDDCVDNTAATRGEVSEIRGKVRTFGEDVQSVHLVVQSLETKISRIEGRQNETNYGVGKLVAFVRSSETSRAKEQIEDFKRDITANMVQRAERNGFRAIILTVDTPGLGRKEADIKNKMIAPPFKNFEGLISTDVVSEKGSNDEAYASEVLDPSFCWKDIAWLKSITKLPILIKGILTSEDATKAIEAGVAGIIVSNHGGRQLDYTPATIYVLEEVVHAVQGKVPVFLDGGVRRGTDIFKALALGAKAVLVGRPVIYGLAAKGETGVKQVIEMLKNELEHTMALAGCCTVDDITRSHVKTEKETFLCRM